VSESAVSDKPLLIYGLARNRRSPKRPSEPRPSGVRPEEAEVGKRRRSLPFEMTDGCYGWEVISTQQALTVILNAVPVAFSTDRHPCKSSVK
jgi:hypothetical protein